MTRQEEIRAIRKRRHKLFYKWLGILVIIPASIFLTSAIFFNIGAMFFDDEAHDDYRLNFGTEMMGVAASIGIAVLFIDRLYANRDRKRLKRRLIREAGSPSNDIALLAVGWLHDEGWLTGNDGSLKKADLSKANLQGAKLQGANLQGANLGNANLKNASLSEANLQRAKLPCARLENANLSRTNLQNAELDYTILQGASLNKANLQEAIMIGADLQGAHLYKADLQGANLLHAKNLKEASYLGTANLAGTKLSFANLQRVDLENTNLRGAELQMTDIQGVNFHGADLREADLRGANLREARIILREIRIQTFSGEELPVDSDEIEEIVHPATALQGAILPNGERYTEKTEIDKFIFPTHSEFSQTVKEINDRFRKKAGLDDLSES